MTNNTKELKKLIKEGVDAYIQIKGQQELLDSIAETAKEKLEMPPADFKARVVAVYQKTYEEEKFEKKREKTETLYSDIDLIVGE